MAQTSTSITPGISMLLLSLIKSEAAHQHQETLGFAQEEVCLSHICQPPVLTLTPAEKIKINLWNIWYTSRLEIG